jgi:DNA-binding GntR family transcriptional regulator
MTSPIPQSSDDDLTLVLPTKLRDAAARVIRAQIASGVLEPGRLYSIKQIADRLGVSATPVREAIIDLNKDELVDIVRNRGCRIRQVDDRDLDELVELRKLIEVPAMRQLASGPCDLSGVTEIAAQVESAAASGDVVEFLARDRDFHLGLLELLGKRRFVKIVGALRDQTRLYGLQQLVGTPLLVESAREHFSLLTAIGAGDVEGTAAVMSRHLAHARGMWAGEGREP